MAFQDRKIELAIAVAAFVVATALAFTSLAISDDHDIAAGVTMVIAQFLLLCASIIGIDYKLNTIPWSGNAHTKTKP